MNKFIVLASVAIVFAAAPASAAKSGNDGNAGKGGGNGGVSNGNNGGGNNGSGNSGGGNGGGSGGNSGSGGNGGIGGGNGGNGGNGSSGSSGSSGQPSATSRACLLTDVSPTASACTGFFAGNLLNNSSIAAQTAALHTLGFAWNGDFAAVTKINSLGGATVVDFATAQLNPVNRLYGDSWVGLHFGGGGPTGIGQQATAFFKINAGLAGLSSFLLTIPTGSSGAVLYRTGAKLIEDGGGTAGAVPEPANWAMLIAGFGLVGASMRRRRGAIA